MRIYSNILIFILSISFFVSPAMVSASSGDQQMKEMSCCTGENHSCHHSSQKENQDKKDSHKGCTDTSCPMNNCHFQIVSIKILTEKKTENSGLIGRISEKMTTNHFSTLILKDLIYTFWHPPEYIS